MERLARYPCRCFIGIDEVGYGPLLGPLVLTGFQVRVPERMPFTRLDQHLKRSTANSSGFKVADSKVLYRGKKDLKKLESVALALWGATTELPLKNLTLHKLWRAATGTPASRLREFPWHQPDLRLPLQAELSEIDTFAARLKHALDEIGAGAFARARVVFPLEFNACCEKLGSKNVALLTWTGQLLRDLGLPRHEPATVIMDQQGGRRNYLPLLQALAADNEYGLVRTTPLREGGVAVLSENMLLLAQPKADARYFLVSACSVMGKYLRELLMHQWNGFITNRVRVAPTAGYGAQARAFVEKLGPFCKRDSSLRDALETYLRRR